MLKKTHQEGGKTAFNLTALTVFLLVPWRNINWYLSMIALILIYFVTLFSSTMKDLDHAEQNMPTKDLFSYVVHCISNKIDGTHRSIITHNLIVDIVLWLAPAYYIYHSNFLKPADYSINFLLFCILISMFYGNLMHIILDMFTVEGAYNPIALYYLAKYKIKGKDINAVRHKLRTNLIFIKTNFVLMYRYPFIKMIELSDYGKTGGQYEAVFRVNLQTFNYFCLYVVLFISVKPDLGRVFRYITWLLS